jgi:peptidoglycan/xylan/chitin deacetylase (PgdA/CDA1 family)
MAGSVVNLTVHGIGPADRPVEEAERGTWVSVAQFEQVLDAVAGLDDVRITFDDGNASDVEIALPRLLERGLTAEFFPLAGLLGEPGRVDAAGVKELVAAGMTIGSHGWAHRDWRRISDATAEQEFTDAHRALAEVAGQPIAHVAVPFGSYDRRVLGYLRAAGVRRVYTSDGGRARPDAWLQARTSLREDTDAAWIRRVLDPAPPLKARARRHAAQAVKRVRTAPRGAVR